MFNKNGLVEFESLSHQECTKEICIQYKSENSRTGIFLTCFTKTKSGDGSHLYNFLNWQSPVKESQKNSMHNLSEPIESLIVSQFGHEVVML